MNLKPTAVRGHNGHPVLGHSLASQNPMQGMPKRKEKSCEEHDICQSRQESCCALSADDLSGLSAQSAASFRVHVHAELRQPGAQMRSELPWSRRVLQDLLCGTASLLSRLLVTRSGWSRPGISRACLQPDPSPETVPSFESPQSLYPDLTLCSLLTLFFLWPVAYDLSPVFSGPSPPGPHRGSRG